MIWNVCAGSDRASALPTAPGPTVGHRQMALHDDSSTSRREGLKFLAYRPIGVRNGWRMAGFC